MKRTLLFLVAALAFPVSFFTTSAYAAPAPPANNSGQALEIAPPVLNLTANPGQTIKTQISLRDISSGKLLVTGEVNDFIAGKEDGTPQILLNTDEASPYSLKAWVKPLSELTLKPREIQNLPVTISVPADAAPGGYYGVVRFTATAPELKGTGVSLSASLGALVLLKVNGSVKEGMSIAELSINQGGKAGPLFESTPLTFVERIKNDGNTHEQPVGQVTITDMFNKKVAVLSVNPERRNVLPQSIRRFEEPLDSSVIGKKMLFGHYKATLNVTYGANKQSVTSTTSFWVIPYRLIAVGILVLVGGFVALRIFIRRYNRHIISQAQKKRR